jgi:prepilin-type N-terminal cleavage/methylation domain-containing protein
MIMKNRAFTLIELMIVVAIIAFLSVLAVPHLFHYKARAYQAEVAMNLASLHTAQQAYFAQHGKYTDVLWGEGGLGWRPAGYKGGGQEEGFYYTYGFSGGQEGVHYFTGKLNTPAQALGQTGATQDSFIAGAAGVIQAKNSPDVWTINESRTLQNIQNGIE